MFTPLTATHETAVFINPVLTTFQLVPLSTLRDTPCEDEAATSVEPAVPLEAKAKECQYEGALFEVSEALFVSTNVKTEILPRKNITLLMNEIHIRHNDSKPIGKFGEG